MVKINLAHTSPINPPGAQPILSQERAWAGLARKSREPQEFVPVVASFEVLSETDITVEGVVKYKPGVAHGRKLRNVCTLTAPCRLDYAIENGSSAVNIISKGGGGEEDLYLTFMFSWDPPDLDDGTPEVTSVRESHELVSQADSLDLLICMV